MKFARPGLEEEFKRAHPRVRAMVLEIEFFCKLHGLPEPVVTHIERSWKQHVRIYGSEEKAKRVHSPHLARPSRAIDLRSSIYTEHEIQRIIAHIESNFHMRRYHHPVVLYHNVGRGWHFHVQTPPDSIYHS